MDARYGDFLRELLRPLGIYDLSAGTVNESELYAAGEGLDGAGALLENAERESLVSTAEAEGLSRREDLFARRPAAASTQLRREAIAALLQIDGDSFSLGDINRTISGCGIRAEAQETETRGLIRVIFPDVIGVPAQFDRISEIIRDIIPCHLETSFYFCFVLWETCEARSTTLEDIQTAEHTWKSFELTV